MTRDQIIKHLQERGYTGSTRSNELFTKPGADGKRFRAAPLVLRLESQVRHSDGTREWIRIRSAYYRDLSITPEGKISGLKRNP